MPHLKDSLHLLNNILTAVEHLKIDLKPEPKSTIEKYGYIIAACLGASIAIIGGIVTFKLNEWKDKKIRKEENAKEDKAIRHKIFAEVKEVTEEFNNAVIQRDLALLKILYQRGEIALTFREEDSFIKNIDVGLDEIDYEAINKNLSEKKKLYFDKLSNYIFHKEAQTEVLKLQTRILTKGLCFKQENFEGLSDKKKLDEFLEFQKKEIHNFWTQEISLPTNQILTYIMQNR